MDVSDVCLVYYILTAKRFGYEIADKVLNLQVEKLSKASDELGKQLYLAIRQIHRTVLEGVDSPFTVAVEGGNLEVPVEYNVALEFLTVSEEAPFHIMKTKYEEKGVPDFREQDFALTACLGHGKAAALNEFLVLTQQAKVTL